MNYEKYLPIGSVVLLNGGTKRIMITGFCAETQADTKVIYDYSGCLYPEGFLSSDQTLLFNHDQIVKIFCIGFIDEEQKQFQTKLNDLVQSLNTQNN